MHPDPIADALSGMTKHAKQPYKCTICNKEGHNSRTCKNINPDKETKTNPSIPGEYIVGHDPFLLLELVTTYEEAVQMCSEEENVYPIANENSPFLARIFPETFQVPEDNNFVHYYESDDTSAEQSSSD